MNKGAIAMLVILAVVLFIFLFVGAANLLANGIIKSGGIKPGIEKLWCGEVGCMDN